MIREVSGEERFVDGHVLEPDDALARLELDDAVHQEHRVAVRQAVKDALHIDVGGPLHRVVRVADRACQRDIPPVARSLRDDVSPQSPAQEGKVANQVAGLVAHELVRVSQRPVQHALPVQQHRVFQGGPKGQSARVQSFCIGREPEGARRRQVAPESLPVDPVRAVLPADRPVREIDRRRHAKPVVGHRHVGRATAVLDGDRLRDHGDGRFRRLGASPCPSHGVKVGREAAVQNRDFRAIQLQERVVDLQGRKRRQQMLDRPDFHVPGAEARAQFRFGDVLQACRDPDRVGQVGAHENNARILGCGPDGHRGFPAGVHPDPMEFDTAGDRVLTVASHQRASPFASRRSSRSTRLTTSGNRMTQAMALR